MFRPVGLAVAPDGSLYFSDWVDESYNVHRKGRIWRLRPRETGTVVPAPRLGTSPNARSDPLSRRELASLPDPDSES